MIAASLPLALLMAVPAHAASGPFLSLGNTNFVVLISFLIFVGALVYFKAPGFAGRMIDGRIDAIRAEIENAAKIREDASDRHATAERERSESIEQARRMTEGAKQDADRLVEEARVSLERATNRRLKAAREQVESAEAAAVASIRQDAVTIAVDVASEAVAASMNAADHREMVSRAIDEIEANIA